MTIETLGIANDKHAMINSLRQMLVRIDLRIANKGGFTYGLIGSPDLQEESVPAEFFPPVDIIEVKRRVEDKIDLLQRELVAL